MSEDFMKELMQWHKDQKKLHKKYALKVMRTHPLDGRGRSVTLDIPSIQSLVIYWSVNVCRILMTLYQFYMNVPILKSLGKH